jgi:large subunit ribosomal protein L21
MMYAVVRTGGKQVRVSPGDCVRVEKISGEVGESVELSDVLLIGDDADVKVGTPTVDGAKVVGTITAQNRHPKIIVFKMKRRTGSRHKAGHRQSFTEIQIDKIEG